MSHPILPAGYNSAPNDGDEVDGAGYNEPIWPVLFDTFEGKRPLIMTEDMLNAFAQECADIVFRHEDDTIVIRGGPRGVVIWPERQEVEIAAEADELDLLREANVVPIRKAG